MPDSAIAGFSAAELRRLLAEQLNMLYRREVPAYGVLLDLVAASNRSVLEGRGGPRARDEAAIAALSTPRHGAIRVGTAQELSQLRRLFALFGMSPVGFYDLVTAGLPVFSTAFRPIDRASIDASPFRMFCSLLRTDLISDAAVRRLAEQTLANRQIVSPRLLALIERAESHGFVPISDAPALVAESVEVFRWSGRARVDASQYRQLHDTHRLIVDVVAFPGPHLNHLTPNVLNIDDFQARLAASKLAAKRSIEGPPQRQCPILLRQTAFSAVAEPIQFADSPLTDATHTARFGEAEQRGAALTPEGRALYDHCLEQHDFSDFPDDWNTLLAEGLIWCRFRTTERTVRAQLLDVDLHSHEQRVAAVRDGVLSAEPIRYEDFLPVSAAGIFRSNLGDDGRVLHHGASRQVDFEAALGAPVIDPQDLYAGEQLASLAAISR